LRFLFLDYNKLYYYLILILAFALPLSRAVISIDIALLILVWLIEGDFREKFIKIKNSKPLIILFIFISLYLTSILWTEHIKDAIRPLRLLLYYFVIFIVATSFNPKYTYKVISAFLAGMFISEIIAYGVFFEFWHFKHASPQDPSPFMLHLEYSIFLAFASIVLLNRLISKKYAIKEKIFYSIFFTTVTGNLFLTMGRTGQVAFILSIFVLVAMHYKLTIKSILLSTLLIATISTIAYNTSNTFKSRVETSSNNLNRLLNNDLNSSLGMRVSFFICVPRIIKDDPLLGVGIGDFHKELKEEINKDKYSYLSGHVRKFVARAKPHCQYLMVLLQLGIVGLILFLLFIFYFYKTSILYIKDLETKELAILFMTIFIISFFADAFLMSQFSLALFVLFTGLFLANARVNN